MTDAAKEHARLPWIEIALTVAGIVLMVGLVLLVPALRHAAIAAVHGETSEVRHQIKSLGVGGPLIIVGLGVLHSVVPYPAEIVNAASGFAYGFWVGLGIVVLGWMVSAVICYWVGTGVARPLLDRFFGASRFARFERMVDRGGITLLIALRLLPIVPFSLISYAAGAARVPFHRYCWTTAVGFLPITALAVYLGTRLEGISASDPAVIGALLGAVVLILLANWIIRRSGARDEATGDESA
ncbi:MAG TPA: VTT domain-containing protein [Solirubrobacterales bacterium]|nr:VTT domain-containing protein [Solirubrobacterales bacterium]